MDAYPTRLSQKAHSLACVTEMRQLWEVREIGDRSAIAQRGMHRNPIFKYMGVAAAAIVTDKGRIWETGIDREVAAGFLDDFSDVGGGRSCNCVAVLRLCDWTFVSLCISTEGGTVAGGGQREGFGGCDCFHWLCWRNIPLCCWEHGERKGGNESWASFHE